jgi:dipeptidyl aminopeptidase/acylaminoacyl peptidase
MMKPFTVEDLYEHRTLQGLCAAPEHDAVVFVHSRPDRKANTYRSTLRMLRTSSKAHSRRLTTPVFNASSPKLSPDGSQVAFLSSRGGDSQQVHLLRLDGGEARQASHSKRELQGIQGWSADARKLLLTVRAPHAEDEHDDPENTTDRPIVVKFLPWKQDGAGPLAGFRMQLMALDLDSGEETVLVEGDFDVAEGQWSPDGKHLAFTRYRSGTQRHRSDVWLARADGSEARQVSHDLASVAHLRWSPDGRRVAFSGACREGDSINNLYVFDIDGGEPQMYGGSDLQLESGVVWHGSDNRVAAVATREGLQEIVIVDLDRDTVEPLHLGLRHVTAVQSSGDRLAFIAASMRLPDEIYTVDWDGNDERRHSAFNRQWIMQRTRPRVTKRRFRVPDGDGEMGTVEAWLLRPQGEGPFPLLLDLHGGPHSATLIDFASHVYWYALLSHGWAILAPNAVGSSGYGAEYSRKLRGRWGELDLPQHLGIIDILQREGIADDRLAVTGKSYGGFLTAWAVGHTDRFKAAVVSAPVANIESHAGTSDTGFYVTPYAMAGEASKHRERYHRLSPVTYCRSITTPTLLLQGEDDQRCPLGQSEEFFENLVRCAKAPAEMVVYPGGSHSMAGTGKLAHRRDYHHRLVTWVRRWVENADSGGD